MYCCARSQNLLPQSPVAGDGARGLLNGARFRSVRAVGDVAKGRGFDDGAAAGRKEDLVVGRRRGRSSCRSVWRRAGGRRGFISGVQIGVGNGFDGIETGSRTGVL